MVSEHRKGFSVFNDKIKYDDKLSCENMTITGHPLCAQKGSRRSQSTKITANVFRKVNPMIDTKTHANTITLLGRSGVLKAEILVAKRFARDQVKIVRSSSILSTGRRHFVPYDQ
jgi:hypothetical protein